MLKYNTTFSIWQARNQKKMIFFQKKCPKNEKNKVLTAKTVRITVRKPNRQPLYLPGSVCCNPARASGYPALKHAKLPVPDRTIPHPAWRGVCCGNGCRETPPGRQRTAPPGAGAAVSGVRHSTSASSPDSRRRRAAGTPSAGSNTSIVSFTHLFRRKKRRLSFGKRRFSNSEISELIP